MIHPSFCIFSLNRTLNKHTELQNTGPLSTLGKETVPVSRLECVTEGWSTDYPDLGGKML